MHEFPIIPTLLKMLKYQTNIFLSQAFGGGGEASTATR